jgi:YbgC/YbaW family acyl-CoA thioester hydrolase
MENAGPASVRIQRRIDWSDTDASGAWHNTAAFRLLEAAETALMDRLGFLQDVYGRHPRVHIEADFRKPLFFRDVVDVRVRVASVGRTSVTYDAEIARADDEEVCAVAKLVAVYLDRIGGTPQPWPEEYRQAFASAGPLPAELLVTES